MGNFKGCGQGVGIGERGAKVAQQHGDSRGDIMMHRKVNGY